MRRYSDIIQYAEYIEMVSIRNLTIIRAKIIIIDGSRVYIREVWRDDNLIDYSYWWLDINNQVIEGWDNSPHHPEVPTFPHHRHTPSGVRELHNPDLLNFFNKIREELL